MPVGTLEAAVVVQDQDAEAPARFGVLSSCPRPSCNQTSPLSGNQLAGEQNAAASDMIDCEIAANVQDLTNDENLCLVRRLRSQERCGKGSIIGLSPDRTQAIIIPLRCKSWDCPSCAKLKREAWIEKLARGNPNRVMTLTADPKIAESVRGRAVLMKAAFSKLIERIRKQVALHPSLRWLPPKNRKQLIEALRKRGKVLTYTRKPEVEYALVWEVAGTNHLHCHVLMRSPYIPHGWLSYQWSKLAIGTVVHIKQARSARWEASHAAKDISRKPQTYMPSPEDYVTKDVARTAEAIAPLYLVQLSDNWELPVPESKNVNPRFDWDFSFSCHSAEEVLIEWLHSHSLISYTPRRGGVFEVLKRPCNSDIEILCARDPERPFDL